MPTKGLASPSLFLTVLHVADPFSKIPLVWSKHSSTAVSLANSLEPPYFDDRFLSLTEIHITVRKFFPSSFIVRSTFRRPFYPANPLGVVAGFQVPRGGWFWVPAGGWFWVPADNCQQVKTARAWKKHRMLNDRGINRPPNYLHEIDEPELWARVVNNDAHQRNCRGLSRTCHYTPLYTSEFTNSIEIGSCNSTSAKGPSVFHSLDVFSEVIKDRPQGVKESPVATHALPK